jgi:hypothetical protein
MTAKLSQQLLMHRQDEVYALNLLSSVAQEVATLAKFWRTWAKVNV